MLVQSCKPSAPLVQSCRLNRKFRTMLQVTNKPLPLRSTKRFGSIGGRLDQRRNYEPFKGCKSFLRQSFFPKARSKLNAALIKAK